MYIVKICPADTVTNPNLSWPALRRPRLPAVALSAGHIVYVHIKAPFLRNGFESSVGTIVAGVSKLAELFSFISRLKKGLDIISYILYPYLKKNSQNFHLFNKKKIVVILHKVIGRLFWTMPIHIVNSKFAIYLCILQKMHIVRLKYPKIDKFVLKRI
jgi:hypothetical protein